MLEFQQKRKIRKMMFSIPVLIVLALVAAVFAHAAWNVHIKEVESSQYLAQAQAQLSNLSAQEQNLTQSVAALNTPEGVDAEIRSEYMVVKPGEQVAVIVDGDDASDTATTTPDESFWSKVTDFFHF